MSFSHSQQKTALKWGLGGNNVRLTSKPLRKVINGSNYNPYLTRTAAFWLVGNCQV